jgi:SAM-dependent methyltransferase
MSAGLLCPSCKAGEVSADGACEFCKTQWPLEQGVLKLLRREHDFYEGAYQAQIHFPEYALGTLRGRVLFPFISFGYLKALVDHVPKGSRLLELGCGGGMQLAATRYEVTAVDLSFASLKGTPEGYRTRIQADVLTLDFRPSSFDAIAASCFWEHFTGPQKELLLDKFLSWLKPGGALVLLFDTASQNPLYRLLRNHPELFRQCFVDHDGHVGLERVAENRSRFAEHGLEQIAGTGLNRTLQHLPVYTWIAPYGQVSWLAKLAAGFGAGMNRMPRLSQAFTGGLHLWDLTVGRAFPLAWSRLYLGVWKKP